MNLHGLLPQTVKGYTCFMSSIFNHTGKGEVFQGRIISDNKFYGIEESQAYTSPTRVGCGSHP